MYIIMEDIWNYENISFFISYVYALYTMHLQKNLRVVILYCPSVGKVELSQPFLIKVL